MINPKANSTQTSSEVWKIPRTLEEWTKNDVCTVKLKMLGELVRYHLDNDGARPRTAAESGRDLVHHPMHKELNSSPEKPDKILIYTAFPESNTIIKDVGGPFPITAHYAEADRTLTSTGRF